MKRYKRNFQSETSAVNSACLFNEKRKVNRPRNCDGYCCMYCLNVRNEHAAYFPLLKLRKTAKNETRPENEKD